MYTFGRIFGENGKADILIEQCYATSVGMNAIEALSMEKVILGGNEGGNAESFGVTDFPIIISNRMKIIYSKLKKLTKTVRGFSPIKRIY